MIPNVFVSSTVADLNHLRDVTRDTITELGLLPVMNEHDGVGFLPQETAEASCYSTISQCQLAIVMIGKRYGNIGKDDVSVTQNEYRTAFERKIPIFCLVDSEVVGFRGVYHANKAKGTLDFPGFDNPEKTFAFLDEILATPRNNAMLPYVGAADARKHIRAQVAHLFGDLLNRHADPVKAEVRDVLAEIRLLKRFIIKQPTSETASIQKALRLLLEEKFEKYRDLMSEFPDSFEGRLTDVLDATTFPQAVEVVSGKELLIAGKGTEKGSFSYYFSLPPEDLRAGTMWRDSVEEDVTSLFGFVVLKNGQVVVNDKAAELLDALHNELREVSSS